MHARVMVNQPPWAMVVVLVAVRLPSVQDTVAEALGTPDGAVALAAVILLSVWDSPAVAAVILIFFLELYTLQMVYFNISCFSSGT
ncbi:UNVERIFIED_CONTAM: hypothetical protein FKN15_047780 [Acipenser sinensis]